MNDDERAAESTASHPRRPPRRNWQDIATMGLLSASMVLMLLVLLFVIGARSGAFEAADASADVKSSQAINSCRSALYAQVVAAGTDLDIAQSELATTNIRGLQAIAREQPGALTEALAAADLIVADTQAKSAALTAATAQYQAAAALAESDPVAFLQQCDPPTGEGH